MRTKPGRIERIGLRDGEGRDIAGTVHKAIKRDASGLFLRAACQPDWLNVGTLEEGIKRRCSKCFPFQLDYTPSMMRDLPSMDIPDFEEPKTLEEIMRKDKVTFARRKIE